MNKNVNRKMKVKKDKRDGSWLRVFIIILLVPVLVAIGVIAGQYMTDGVMPIIVNSQQQVESTTVSMDEFLLNLESPNKTGKYVRLQISLSTSLKDGEEEINENMDKIRDAVIEVVSNETAESLLGSDGTSNLKNSIKQKINERFEGGLVDEVYVVNLVVQ